MAAPKKDIVKSEWLQVRMTKEQKEQARDRAQNLGVSLSEYVCRLIEADC